jgi:hypothetical protein
MDRKSIIILVVCFLLLFSWPLLVNKVFPPKRIPPGSTNAPVSSLSVPNPPGTTSISTSAPPQLESQPVAPLITDTNQPEQLLELTNNSVHYTFSSYGGGLKLVELLARECSWRDARYIHPESNSGSAGRSSPPGRRHL